MASGKGTMQVEESRKTLRDDLQVLIVITAGPEKGKKYEIRYLEISIGRKDPVQRYDVEIDDNYISGSSVSHAFINFSGSNIYIQDNESTNGTFVDGVQIYRKDIELVIANKSIVRLGKETEFKIEIRKRPKG
jgi:pSer/pThr/pTyr-binding forkhead associated (FHA) protein